MDLKHAVNLLAMLAALSFGTAQAAGEDREAPEAPDASESTAPPAAGGQGKKSLSKQEALSNGVPEAIFNQADTNKDGKLDAKEIAAHNEKVRKSSPPQ
ncbi:EF-hand domain-containing protein [Candidatus Methylocalor cossyra]|uniref:EF-hand domain-containing protein n=1 Tax=Candidatus Methylocalor cossyra TaxID=3108543 RepID=A0ABM9NIT8_9GAMM